MIQLQKLILKGFGIFKDEKTIIFDNGLNIIQAQNGSGKSTSIQAIEMLLAANYEGSYEEYINHNSNEFFIQLYCILNLKEYVITLNCKRSKSGSISTSKTIEHNDNILASGEEATQYISSLIDSTLVRYSLIAKQKPIDNIVTCKDAERMDLFKKFKNLNFEKIVSNKITPIIDECKQINLSLEKFIYNLENKKYDFKEVPLSPYDIIKYNDYKNEELLLLKEQSNIDMSKQLYNSKIELLNKSKNDLDSINVSIQTKQSKKIKLQSDVNTLNLSIKEKESDSYLESKLEELKLEYENKKEQQKKIYIHKHVSLRQQEVELNEKKLNLEKDINKLCSEIDSIKILKLKDVDDTLLLSIKTDISLLKQEILLIEKNITSFERGICPTCGGNCSHKLEDNINYKKELELQLIKLESKLNLEQTEINKQKEQIEINKQNKERKQSLVNSKLIEEEKLNSIISQIETNKKEINLLKENDETLISSLNSQYQKNTNNIKLLIGSEIESIRNSIHDKQNQIEDINTEISNLSKKILDIDSMIMSLTESISKIKIIDFDENTLRSLQNKIKEYNDYILIKSTYEEINSKLQKEKEEDYILLQSYYDQKKENEVKQYNYEQAKTILLKDFPNFVIESSIEDVEKNMNDFIESVYYKSLNVSLRATKTNIKLEYGTGDKKILAHRLSGAESKLVSLSFIHNSNKYAEFNCLILDEPDAALDNIRQEEMYDILLNMKDIYQQLIIVSHSEKMLNYLTSNLECNIIII